MVMMASLCTHHASRHQCQGNRSGSQCLIKRTAQGERPRRSWAFNDAVFDSGLSVADQVHPLVVQFGIELTDSPPLCLKELLPIKSRLALQHVIDRPCQCMSQDGQCLALAVFVLEAGEQLLRGRIIPQE
jgi:hypothetical protein